MTIKHPNWQPRPDPNTYAFTADNGIPYMARLLRPGDGYGYYEAANDSWAMQVEPDSRPMIEFFDARYPHTPYGQFTGGRYFVETLAEGSARSSGLHIQFPWVLDARSIRQVLSWADQRLQRDVNRPDPLRQQARADMEGFEYRLLASGERDTVEVWRAQHPDNFHNAFDIVCTRMGICAYGDIGHLAWDVDARRGLPFLAGGDIAYLHAKLGETFRRDQVVDPRLVRGFVADAVGQYLQEAWGPLRDTLPVPLVAAADRLVRAPDPFLATADFCRECTRASSGAGDDLSNLIADLEDQTTEEGIGRVLQEASDDFGGAFDGLAGVSFTVPSPHLLRRLHMVNIAAQEIMKLRECELPSAGQPARVREGSGA